jgi:hypothetical protein
MRLGPPSNFSPWGHLGWKRSHHRTFDMGDGILDGRSCRLTAKKLDHSTTWDVIGCLGLASCLIESFGLAVQIWRRRCLPLSAQLSLPTTEQFSSITCYHTSASLYTKYQQRHTSVIASSRNTTTIRSCNQNLKQSTHPSSLPRPITTTPPSTWVPSSPA